MGCVTVVEISFDKVVGHLFIDFLSFVTHKAPPWLAPSGEILQIWPVQIARNLYFILL